MMACTKACHLKIMLGYLVKRTIYHTGSARPTDVTLKMEYRKLWGICKP